MEEIQRFEPDIGNMIPTENGKWVSFGARNSEINYLQSQIDDLKLQSHKDSVQINDLVELGLRQTIKIKELNEELKVSTKLHADLSDRFMDCQIDLWIKETKPRNVQYVKVPPAVDVVNQTENQITIIDKEKES